VRRVLIWLIHSPGFFSERPAFSANPIQANYVETKVETKAYDPVSPPQSSPCTKPSTLVTGLSALFDLGARCGRHRATSSRHPLSCTNDQNVAVPACGLSY
jgi:hypothetical protein